MNSGVFPQLAYGPEGSKGRLEYWNAGKNIWNVGILE
jgi:hypothetical protein